jgi:plasmid replication initiation protein
MLIEVIILTIVCGLSLLYTPITPVVFTLLALFFLYKISTLQEQINILDERTVKLSEEIKSLYKNQKDISLVITTIRTRINKLKSNGKTSENSKVRSFKERLDDIEHREQQLIDEEQDSI